VPPGGIHVGVPLPLRTVLREVALPVRVGGHVRGVDGEVGPVLGTLGVEGGGDAGDAGVEQVAVGAELRAEAVASVHARDGAADGLSERGVLGDERHGAGPLRHRVHALGESHTDHRSERVAGAAGPAGGLKLVYEPPDFGGVEECSDLFGVGGPWYVGRGHGALLSVVLAPGSANFAGAVFSLFSTPNLLLLSDGKRL